MNPSAAARGAGDEAVAPGPEPAGRLLPPEAWPDERTACGWVVADPSDPEDAPEVALEIEGLGGVVVVASSPASPEFAAPEGACGFRCALPAHEGEASPRRLRAWHVGTARELAGSPVLLPPSAVAAPGTAPRWIRPLAGHIGAGMPQRLADDLWVAGSGAASLLRYEALNPEPGRGRSSGIRLLAEAGPGTISLLVRPEGSWPKPGTPSNVAVVAWLPAAFEPVAQAQAELWLARREAERFVPLKRLRRHRIFRQPALLSAELLLSEEEAAADLWLTLSVADTRGLCALSARIGEEPTTPTRMEDPRLERAFGHLAELARLHRGIGGAPAGLLPAPACAPAAALPATAAGERHPFTQVIVPVCNGDRIVRECLRSLRSAITGPCEVLVVDDASRAFTAEMLRAELEGDPRFRLFRRDANRGYTKSVNEGLRMAEAPWVVILNSDTLVPRGWLDRLHAAARARPGTGMVGPLSNAASWQSIPETRRPDGSWSTNDIIAPDRLEEVQSLLDAVSERAYPEFPALNGFATLIAREVFDRVGLYDEEAFPKGYGEETDLCFRARRAGFRLTVADDCFVYHHKSVSFGADRQRLTRAGNLELANKHLGANTAALEREMQSCPPLARLRQRMAELLAEGGRACP